jgi:HEXXH motif-containing protein
MAFPVFSNPFEGDFLTLAESLACRQFIATIDRVNQLARRLNVPEVPVGVEGIKPTLLGARCWRPETGFVRMGLRSNSKEGEDWSWIAGQMALATFICGAAPSLEVEMTSKHPTTVAGNMFDAGHLVIKGEEGKLEVTAEGRPPVTFTQFTGKDMTPVWVRDPEHDLIPLGSAAVCVRADGKWVDHWDADAPKDIRTGDFEDFYRQLEEAADVLEQSAPLYYVWVLTLLRELVPLKADQLAGGTSSRSFLFCPGQVHLSTPATLLQTVNMLVHECSHQFFHMLQWSMPIVKEGAPEVFSVLKNTNRPLEKVLLGFHAFANMRLALDLLRANPDGIQMDSLAKHERDVGATVISLDAGLQRYAAEYLEPAGQALYVPLRAKLVSAELLAA